MLISQSARVAIKALLQVASSSGIQHPLTVKQIAENTDENEHTIGKILQSLVKSKKISSKKGPAGGFFLNEIQLNTPIIEIISLIDGDGIFADCVLGLAKCHSENPCPLHTDYLKIRDNMIQLFSKYTILELSKGVIIAQAFLSTKMNKHAD